jgi:beta-phosphoglucomutase
MMNSERPFRFAGAWAGDLFRHARAAIFDMDGVLADTERFHLESWVVLLRERFGLDVPPEVIRRTFGQSNEKIFPLLVPPENALDPAAIPRLSDEKEALYREVARGRVRPIPGVETFLDWLVRRGIPAAVGTSGSRENVRFILEEFGWEGRFQVLVDRSMFRASKPAPDCFLEAARRLGVRADSTVVFEDSIHGLLAARAAGAAPVGIATTHGEETIRHLGRWTFRDFREISCD